MADPQIITTLTRKRDEIEAAIKAYEKKIALAKRDLSSVNATMRLFKLDGDPSEFPTYIDTLRLFNRGEIVTLSKAAMVQEGPGAPATGEARRVQSGWGSARTSPYGPSKGYRGSFRSTPVSR